LLYDTRTPLDVIMYKEFVTYKELQKIIPIEFSDDNETDTINVYIDLYQFLVTLFRYTRVGNYFNISACIINYCAHIRNYFNTRHNVYTNICLVYSTNDSTNNTRFISNYNFDYKNRMKYNVKIRRNVEENMKLVRLLVPYIPNVFLKEGTVETSVIIHDIIQKKLLGDNPSIIISNSQLMYQVPVNNPNTIVIKKDMRFYTDPNDSRTYSYNYYDATRAYIYELKKINIYDDISPKAISLLMTLIGVPKRNIKSFCSYKTALAISKLTPLGCESDPEILFGVCEEYYKSKHRKNTPIIEGQFNRVFRCIDLKFQYKLYEQLPEYNQDGFIIENLDDAEGIQYINNKYFRDSPLNLECF
jgi:hypothetical protein